jgi:hypothetical protein
MSWVISKVKIELRNSEQYDRLPDLASEFARRPVTAMFADNLAAAVAARAATATIPAIGGDPIRAGLVTASAGRRNLTGSLFNGDSACSGPVSQGEPAGNERSGLPEFEFFVRMPTEMRSQSGAGTSNREELSGRT